jgi:NADH:ubiquinone oxidoreductase subunit E
MGDCSKGPNIRIGDTTYQGLPADEVVQLVVHELKEWEGMQ